VKKPWQETATTKDLCELLEYQASPGIHTYGCGSCGHYARGCNICTACIDHELRRRGIDITSMYWGVIYTRREGGVIVRSERSGWIDRETGEMVEISDERPDRPCRVGACG
jgi:hypothetical protein